LSHNLRISFGDWHRGKGNLRGNRHDRCTSTETVASRRRDAKLCPKTISEAARNMTTKRAETFVCYNPLLETVICSRGMWRHILLSKSVKW